MKKTAKAKMKANPQTVTPHTLWTAPVKKDDVKYDVKNAEELTAQWKRALEDSQKQLDEKLKSFETASMPEAAIKYIVR
jgi:hypothetical protein